MVQSLPQMALGLDQLQQGPGLGGVSQLPNSAKPCCCLGLRSGLFLGPKMRKGQLFIVCRHSCGEDDRLIESELSARLASCLTEDKNF